MTQLTVTDLENAKQDVDTIAGIANSTANTVTDRLGATRRTIYSLSNEYPNASANAAAAAASEAAAASAAASAAAASGILWLQEKNAGSSGRLLIRNTTNNSPTRVHIEPKGFVEDGTVSKLDLMLDAYEDDPVNYRIVNLYTKVGNGDGLNGENGATVLGVKGVGDHFGIYPSLHFGFGDDGATGVPMKMYYFDMSDTAWRTPMRGAWRQGRSVTAGDYILANFCLYQAQNTGTTGGTKPNHTSGTVSDGAVNWLFVRNYSGATSNNIKPVILFGDRDDMPKFNLQNTRVQCAKDVALWNGVNLSFLSNASPVASVAYNIYAPSNTLDLYVKSTASGAGFFRFGGTGKYVQMSALAHLCSQKSDTSGNVNVDVSASEIITVAPSSAITVTSFTGGLSYQKFFIQAGNNNTTLQHNANIVLIGGVNKTLTSGQILQFIMNGGGTVAYQV